MQYNLDGLFYDVKNKTLIVFGFFDCLDKGKLIELNDTNRHPIRKRRKERKEKLNYFLKVFKK